MLAKGFARSTPVSGPGLARALAAVEGRLHFLYSRNDLDDPQRRLAIILAATDPQSPLWDEIMQISYLENAREGLQHALQALDQHHGRQQ